MTRRPWQVNAARYFVVPMMNSGLSFAISISDKHLVEEYALGRGHTKDKANMVVYEVIEVKTDPHTVNWSSTV